MSPSSFSFTFLFLQPLDGRSVYDGGISIDTDPVGIRAQTIVHDCLDNEIVVGDVSQSACDGTLLPKDSNLAANLVVGGRNGRVEALVDWGEAVIF